MAEAKSTLVVIGGVLDYHEPCAKARAQGLVVERVYGSQAPLRIVAASQANWQCGLAELLTEIGMRDWRVAAEVGPAIRFKSAIASGAQAPSLPCQSLPMPRCLLALVCCVHMT